MGLQLLTGKSQAENAIQMQTWAMPYGTSRMVSVESRVQRREPGPKAEEEREKDWSCCLRGDRGGSGKGNGRGGRRGTHTQGNSMDILLNFCLFFFFFLLFNFSKNVSIWYQFLFHQLLKFQCPYYTSIKVRVLKEVKNNLE